MDNTNKQQLNIVDQIKASFDDGKQIIILTGGPGAGKTYQINNYLTNTYGEKEEKKKVLKLAPTGAAASNIGGMTLHKFLNAGQEGYNDFMLNHIIRDEYLLNITAKIKKTKLELIVIDEGFALGKKLLTKLDLLFRKIYDSILPFGGLKVILLGDAMQLAPVGDTLPTLYEPLFYNTESIFIKGSQRSTDPKLSVLIKEFQAKGYVEKNNKIIKELENRKGDYLAKDVTSLTALNETRRNINHDYVIQTLGIADPLQLAGYERMKKWDSVAKTYIEYPKIETYYIGQPVIIKENHFFDGIQEKYNGKIAEITNIEYGVKSTGQVIKYGKYDLVTNYNKVVTVKISYKHKKETNYGLIDTEEDFITDVVFNKQYGCFEIPKEIIEHDGFKDAEYDYGNTQKRADMSKVLIPAKAITSHIAQGRTITDKISIHLSDSMHPSSAYVALTRAKSLGQIVSADFSDTSLQIDDTYYKTFLYFKDNQYPRYNDYINYVFNEESPYGLGAHKESIYTNDKEGNRVIGVLSDPKTNLEEYAPLWFKEFASKTGFKPIGNIAKLNMLHKDTLKAEIEDTFVKTEGYWSVTVQEGPKKTQHFSTQAINFLEQTKYRSYTSGALYRIKSKEERAFLKGKKKDSSVLSNNNNIMYSVKSFVIDYDNIIGIGDNGQDRTLEGTINAFRDTCNFTGIKPNTISVSGSQGAHLEFMLGFDIIVDPVIRGGKNSINKNNININDGFLLANLIKRGLEETYWDRDRKDQYHQGLNQATTISGALTKTGAAGLELDPKNYIDTEGTRTASLFITNGRLTDEQIIKLAMTSVEEEKAKNGNPRITNLTEERIREILKQEKEISEYAKFLSRPEMVEKYNPVNIEKKAKKRPSQKIIPDKLLKGRILDLTNRVESGIGSQKFINQISNGMAGLLYKGYSEQQVIEAYKDVVAYNIQTGKIDFKYNNKDNRAINKVLTKALEQANQTKNNTGSKELSRTSLEKHKVTKELDKEQIEKMSEELKEKFFETVDIANKSDWALKLSTNNIIPYQDASKDKVNKIADLIFNLQLDPLQLFNNTKLADTLRYDLSKVTTSNGKSFLTAREKKRRADFDTLLIYVASNQVLRSNNIDLNDIKTYEKLKKVKSGTVKPKLTSNAEIRNLVKEINDDATITDKVSTFIEKLEELSQNSECGNARRFYITAEAFINQRSNRLDDKLSKFEISNGGTGQEIIKYIKNRAEELRGDTSASSSCKQTESTALDDSLYLDLYNSARDNNTLIGFIDYRSIKAGLQQHIHVLEQITEKKIDEIMANPKDILSGDKAYLVPLYNKVLIYSTFDKATDLVAEKFGYKSKNKVKDGTWIHSKEIARIYQGTTINNIGALSIDKAQLFYAQTMEKLEQLEKFIEKGPKALKEKLAKKMANPEDEKIAKEYLLLRESYITNYYTKQLKRCRTNKTKLIKTYNKLIDDTYGYKSGEYGERQFRQQALMNILRSISPFVYRLAKDTAKKTKTLGCIQNEKLVALYAKPYIKPVREGAKKQDKKLMEEKDINMGSLNVSKNSDATLEVDQVQD